MLLGLDHPEAQALRAANEITAGRYAEGALAFDLAWKEQSTLLGKRKQLFGEASSWLYLLALIVFTAVAAIVGGGLSGVGAVFSPDLSTLAAYFTPVAILYLVFTSFIGALATAITVGVSADAYRQLAGGGESEVFA